MFIIIESKGRARTLAREYLRKIVNIPRIGYDFKRANISVTLAL